MFYKNIKESLKKYPNIWKFLTRLKDYSIHFSRIKDVIMMMITFHIWPEQTYKFSSRKHLPSKKNRFSKDTKPIIPYKLLKSKSSDIPMMKEINIVGIGSSFDINDLKNLKGPIFHIPSWGPLRTDKNGKIFRKHDFLYKEFKWNNIDENLDDNINKEYKKNNLTYVVLSDEKGQKVIESLKKKGNNILAISVCRTGEDGNYHPLEKIWENNSFRALFDHVQCRMITVAEKVYKPPLKAPYTNWAPTKSFLPHLCALSFFAEKINVYGWDFYLDSSPENQGYWKLFFNMI